MAEPSRPASIDAPQRSTNKAHRSEGLQLVDRPDPVPGPADVKIKVLRTGICGTDLHIQAWDRWAQGEINPPIVPGQEFFGEVIDIGCDINGVQIGTQVSGEGHIVCGGCRNCRAGRRHMCIKTVGIGVHREGAFAEFVVIPQTNLWVHHKRHRP